MLQLLAVWWWWWWLWFIFQVQLFEQIKNQSFVLHTRTLPLLVTAPISTPPPKPNKVAPFDDGDEFCPRTAAPPVRTAQGPQPPAPTSGPFHLRVTSPLLSTPCRKRAAAPRPRRRPPFFPFFFFFKRSSTIVLFVMRFVPTYPWQSVFLSRLFTKIAPVRYLRDIVAPGVAHPRV